MANIGYATLQVIPSLKGFSSKLRLGMGGALVSESKKAGESSGRSFGSTFAKFAAVGVAAAGAIHVGKSLFDAALESQKVGKQTEAVLKSMGDQAGLTAKDIGKLATKQSLLSGVDDEVIQSAQNVLLTFGKVRNEVGKGNQVFNRGSQAALDMSVALKTDLKSATIQVGKALNDPIKGITALGRAGVSFSEDQKKTIKTLVATGDTLGAQKIILKELESEFSGSAASQATAGDRLKVAWGNVEEELGAKLIPIFESIAGWLADQLPGAMAAVENFINTRLVPAFRNIRDWIEVHILPAAMSFRDFLRDEFLPRLVELGDWIISHDAVLKGFATILGVWAVLAFAAAAPIYLVAAAILAAAAAAIWLYDHNSGFKSFVDTEVEGWSIIFGWIETAYNTLKRFMDLYDNFTGTLGFHAGKDLQKKAIGNVDQGFLPGLVTSATKPHGVLGKQIPKFAMGGVMPGVRGVHSLAWVAGGETILPTHKANMAPLAGGAANGVAVDVNVGLAPGADTGVASAILRMFRVNSGHRSELKQLVA